MYACASVAVFTTNQGFITRRSIKTISSLMTDVTNVRKRLLSETLVVI